MPTALSTTNATRRTFTPRFMGYPLPCRGGRGGPAAPRGAGRPRLARQSARQGRRRSWLGRGRLAAGRTEHSHDVGWCDRAHRRLERRRERLARRAERGGRAEVEDVGQLLAGRLDHVVEVDVHVEESVGIVTADDVGSLLGKREAGDHRETICQRVPGVTQLGQGGLQVAQRRHDVVGAPVQHPSADDAELVELAQHGDECPVLPVEHLQCGSHAVDGLADDVLLLDQGGGEAVDRLHRGDDVALLLIEAADHPVEVAQQVPRLVLTSVHHRVQLMADRLRAAPPHRRTRASTGPPAPLRPRGCDPSGRAG